MRNSNSIHNSFQNSIRYLRMSDFTGYDPYDGANSGLDLINKHRLTRLISTYVNKFSPLNMRRLLRIPKIMQNQSLALIGRAILYEYEIYKKEITRICEKLISESLIDKYGYHCWDAHGFQIQMRSGLREVGMTDVIGNEVIGRFFLELYKQKPDDRYKEICISVRDFLLHEYLIEYKNTIFFKYTPAAPEHKWCYNASTIAAAYCLTVSRYFEIDYDVYSVEKAYRDVITRQKEGGEWWYSLNLNTGYEKPQIDFHQGFILDTLLEYMEYTGYNEPFLNAYKKGLEFYYQKQFLTTGQGIYRYPRKYPVNIHNQAQGIITFTRAAAAGFGEHYVDFARTIAEWTIRNMQDPDGYFYYLKYPLFTNKIPYIRWSDAAMVYALAVYLNHTGSSVQDPYNRKYDRFERSISK